MKERGFILVLKLPIVMKFRGGRFARVLETFRTEPRKVCVSKSALFGHIRPIVRKFLQSMSLHDKSLFYQNVSSNLPGLSSSRIAWAVNEVLADMNRKTWRNGKTEGCGKPKARKDRTAKMTI